MNKQELIEYALTHTKEETYKYFDTSRYKLIKFCEANELIFNELFGHLTFDQFISKVSKEEFYQFYKDHNVKDTLKHFKISQYVFSNCLKYFNITKTQEEINNTRAKTSQKLYNVDHYCKLKISTLKSKQTREERYGDPNYVNIEKSLKTREERYGSKSYHNIEKMKQTNLERTGYEYSFQNPETYQKVCDTKTIKHGNPYYNNPEKREQTSLEKWGVKCNFASKDDSINGRGTQRKIHEETGIWNNRPQAIQTCKDKYGEDFFYSQVDLMLKTISSRGHSKVNEDFFDFLISKGLIPQEQDFNIENFFYDFKLGDYLLEVNPYATHNSSWNIWGKEPLPSDYHRRKTLVALQNGYKCVHIFDWIMIEPILYHILEKDLDIVDTGKPVKHIYDTKNKCLTNKESENTVIIYDDGFNVIF